MTQRPPVMSAHVLVVEDNPHVAGALTILLESAGARVSVAASVADAVRLCRADPPSLMLLDLTLPDGDGLEVLAQLRREGVATPVTVALTGKDGADTHARCLAAGCRDVLIKPMGAKDVVGLVAKYVT